MATLIAQPGVQEALAEHRAARKAVWAADEKLEATLTEQQRPLYRECSDARTAMAGAETGMLSALLLAHAGTMALVLRLLIEHCHDGNCDCFATEQEGA